LANTTGAANTFLGAGACANITTGNGDICIGYGVSAGSSGTSNTILIGTEGVHTAAYVAGIYSEAVGATNSLVCVDNNGKLGTNSCTGAGTGTVTSVGSGLGLTGGPITTSGTLKIDTTIVPLLNTANVFTANQTINGSLSATSSSSDGVLGVSNVDNTGCPSIGCAGVVGVENGSINDTIGVYGYTASSVGAGVYGQNQSPSLVAGIPPDPSAGVWGDSSNQVGVQGTSDNNSAFYGENNTPGNSIATGWFVNDSSTVGDLVVEADGGNGSCLIDVNGDLSCSGALSANNITTGSGGTNTDLAGSCTLTGGTCSQTFSTSYLPAPICVATDTSTVSAVQVSVTSTTLTITGPPGDGANYICIGQEVPPPMKLGHGHRKVHRSPAVRAGSRENK